MYPNRRVLKNSTRLSAPAGSPISDGSDKPPPEPPPTADSSAVAMLLRAVHPTAPTTDDQINLL